jgi:hypothetical protein
VIVGEVSTIGGDLIQMRLFKDVAALELEDKDGSAEE